MTNNPDSRGFLSGRLEPIVVTIVATALLVFVACFMVWYHLGGGAWRGGVSVMGARLDAPDRLALAVASCNGNPSVSSLKETGVDVQVRVIAFSTPFHGGGDCQDSVTAYLGEPLGDRVVVDKHTGQRVSLVRPIPYTVADTQPSANWTAVKVPGWPSQKGFSLHLPPGWELNLPQGLQVNDPYAGEVVGDGVRLTFDYGGPSWSLAPTDDPSHNYGFGYETIGGVNAQLLISMDHGAGYTGAFLHQSGGPNLHLVGEELTPEQQRLAVTVFRSIRLLGR